MALDLLSGWDRGPPLPPRVAATPDEQVEMGQPW